MSEDASAGRPAMTEEMLRRRRGRNIAILVALMVLVGLVYWISVVRIGAGIEADLERQQDQQQEQGTDPADAPDQHGSLPMASGSRVA